MGDILLNRTGQDRAGQGRTGRRSILLHAVLSGVDYSTGLQDYSITASHHHVYYGDEYVCTQQRDTIPCPGTTICMAIDSACKEWATQTLSASTEYS